MIEPVRDRLTSSLQGEALEVDKRWIRLMKQQIQTAEVEIIADFGTARVTFTDILNMRVGDVIPLATNETIVAQIDGVPIMDCSYGQLNGQYALRVEKLLSVSQSDMSNEFTQGE
jgi:flagellar motor switch protein FliM